MFNNSAFNEWLDEKAVEVFEKLEADQTVEPEEMFFLVLKAQAHHFTRFDSDLCGEMKLLYEYIERRFELMDWRFEAMDKRFDAVDRHFTQMRKDMDQRFGAVDKRVALTQWLIGTGIVLLAAMIAFF